MRAIQISELTGPSGLKVVDVPEPEATHPLAPDGDVVIIDVEAAGVSFPEVLQSRGEYQLKPELPFIPGAEVAGIVRSAPEGSAHQPGDRVVVDVHARRLRRDRRRPGLPDLPRSTTRSTSRRAPALVLNYHTAYFSLVTRGQARGGGDRARPRRGGRRRHRDAAGRQGPGRAHDRGRLRRREGGGRARGPAPTRCSAPAGSWKDEVRAAGSADIVVDPVGGDRVTDSLRSLKEEGRLVIVGFTAGSIPEVKVNRLLLNNLSVVGRGLGRLRALQAGPQRGDPGRRSTS